MKQKVILTGIKPTGSPHLGNYVGCIKPALAMEGDYLRLFFIADYHALTASESPKEFRQHCYEVAATWLAMGLDPSKVIFYRQSDIPEVFELSWILGCSTSKGLMNRAHAYKSVVDTNREKGVEDVDAGVNIGLYTYPVLMAADILMFQTDLVPVGSDQVQHIEMARDIAERFNSKYGKVLHLPNFVIQKDVAAIPGLDGRKMSKSYDNTIPLFAPSERLRKLIFRIKTDSTLPDEPKDPDSSLLFTIYREFAQPEQAESMRARLVAGQLSWADTKQELFELLDTFFTEPRKRYNELMENTDHIDRLLAEGAERALQMARPFMARVRKAIGCTTSIG